MAKFTSISIKKKNNDLFLQRGEKKVLKEKGKYEMVIKMMPSLLPGTEHKKTASAEAERQSREKKKASLDARI